MKAYRLSLTLFLLTVNFASGEIKNGYTNGIQSAWASLKNLQALLHDNKKETASQNRMLEAKLKEVVNYIAYYELTQNLLNQFKSIATELYNEIDTIKDRRGRSTDVYIKFISGENAGMQVSGITNVGQMSGDHDAYQSEYGEHTVSVKVWIVNKALFVLSHELGHVKYQVLNLATYFEYHRMKYIPGKTEPYRMGHNVDDPSGKKAVAFAKKFREKYASYLKNAYYQFESPHLLMENTRKKIQSEILIAFPSERI